MTIDLSNLKVGDKVRLRNGAIRTVIAVDKSDQYLPIKLDCRNTYPWYFADGKYNEYSESDLDIIDTEPDLDDEVYKLPTPHFVITPGKGVVRIKYAGKEFTPADAWPEPITDRAPTEDDADEDGEIQRFTAGGWHCETLSNGFDHSEGWRHTPTWQPKPKPAHTRDEVLADLRKWRTGEAPIMTSDFVESLITHLQAANV